MNIRFAKAQFLRAARLRHIVDAISEIHYGPGATSTWDGGAERGELCFDNGCGDALAVAWDERGIVGLNFDHESELPRYQLGVADDVVPPSRAFPGVPEALLPLLREAAQWAGGEFTGAFWAVGNSSVKVAGTEDFGCWFPEDERGWMSEFSVEDWAEQFSLDVPQVELAIRLADGEWGVVLGTVDTECMMAAPEEAKGSPRDDEAAERAATMLAEVGIEWAPPLEQLAANRSAFEEERKARATEALGDVGVRLFDAVRSGDVERAREMLAAGADPNARTVPDQYDWTPQGDTPLIQAVKKSHEGVARLLLEHGADPTLSNCYEQSALHWAIRGQLKDLAATLIERGCDVRQPDSKGWTPLHSAAAEGHAELVTLLLDAGAELGAEHSGGLTALEVAQLREQDAVVALLKARK